MAITPAIQPRLILDEESERSTGWPDGTEVFCKDTGKSYILDASAWVLTGISADALKTFIEESITDGTIPIVLNGKVLVIDGDTGVVSSEDSE